MEMDERRPLNPDGDKQTRLRRSGMAREIRRELNEDPSSSGQANQGYTVTSLCTMDVTS